ncbi:MAG TPA: hypothetical protein VFQ88_16010 [Nevskiaceae bacterium]|nr:hypothetical protein [Nevskiaceae bacterium]
MTPDTDGPATDDSIMRAERQANDAAARAPLPPPPPPAAVVVLLLLVAAFLGGIVAPTVLMLWEAVHATTVIAEGSAGRFESASSSPGGFFSPTLTSVQTSTGTITVKGTFSALRGEPIIVTADNKHDSLRLCTMGARTVCATLDGGWAGTLMPTPRARHTVNFVRHGFSIHNLDQWLAFGMLATLAAFAIAVATAGRQDHDDGDADTT